MPDQGRSPSMLILLIGGPLKWDPQRQASRVGNRVRRTSNSGWDRFVLPLGLGFPPAHTLYNRWARGTVKSLAKSGENAGMYGIKFVSEQLIRFLELREEDYDTDGIWVQIKKASSS